MMSRNMIIQIALPLLLIGAVPFAVGQIRFKPVMTPKETQIERFVSETVETSERQYIEARGLRSPFEIVRQAAKKFPSTPLSAVAPQPQEKPPELKVSMIVISEGRRLAIVNGSVLREGDNLSGMRIARIEKDRVLLKKEEPGAREPVAIWAILEGSK